MKVPTFLSPFLDGDSPKRLIQGLAAGAIGTMVIGFGWGGWNVGSTVQLKIETASLEAMVSALAPICADKFKQAAKADNNLVSKIEAIDSWQRDVYLKQAGWVTFPGGAEPNYEVAEACATLLSKALKLK